MGDVYLVLAQPRSQGCQTKQNNNKQSKLKRKVVCREEVSFATKARRASRGIAQMKRTGQNAHVRSTSMQIGISQRRITLQQRGLLRSRSLERLKNTTPPLSYSALQSLLSTQHASLCTDDARSSYTKHGMPLGKLISQVLRSPCVQMFRSFGEKYNVKKRV